MKDILLIIKSQLKMGYTLSFAEVMLLQQAIDIAVENAGNSPAVHEGWVACSDRMPSVGEQVLACRPDSPKSDDPLIRMVTYVGRSAHGHGFDCYCKPTHWMPLPAAPQQEETRD